ncbi:GIY-YIG nuclease family protein [Streptomyces melanogenes]|uniref:GIY-YIG nuclease family protein n=1 Tax=Streptomyces melanogenes TaxID=67326 RepID=UPI0037A37120
MVDEEPRRWVYLVGSPHMRIVKIGTSSAPQTRLRDLQTGSPVRLHLLWTTPGGPDLEAALHAHFSPYRVHGEWFDFGEEHPVSIVSAATAGLGCAKQNGESAVYTLTATQRVVLGAASDGATTSQSISVVTRMGIAHVCREVDALVRLGFLSREGTTIHFGCAANAIELKGTRKRVMEAITAMPWPHRVPAVARAAGLSEKTVAKHVEKLIESGFLTLQAGGFLSVTTAGEDQHG